MRSLSSATLLPCVLLDQMFQQALKESPAGSWAPRQHAIVNSGGKVSYKYIQSGACARSLRRLCVCVCVILLLAFALRMDIQSNILPTRMRCYIFGRYHVKDHSGYRVCIVCTLRLRSYRSAVPIKKNKKKNVSTPIIPSENVDHVSYPSGYRSGH